MKNDKLKKLLLEQLKKVPVVELACQKTGVGRTTYYTWRKNKEFAEATDRAIADGETFITDMSQSGLISLIHERSFRAISLWLKTHHPKFGEKVEITGNLNVKEESLTPEQETIVKEALRLASPIVDTGIKKINQNNNQNDDDQQHLTAEPSRTDV